MNDSPTPPAASDEDEAILAFTSAPPTCGRADGWTARRQTDFIHALAVMGTVTRACNAVGMSRQTAYKLCERPEAADFARAWDAALMMGHDRLFSMAMDRAPTASSKPPRQSKASVNFRARPAPRRPPTTPMP